MKLPAKMFGVGRYTVTVELPQASGLYGSSNVTYRGVEVGRVESVKLTDTGVEAVLSLKSGHQHPVGSGSRTCTASRRSANSTSLLLPRNATSPPLKNGDVIPLADTSVPPDINTILLPGGHRSEGGAAGTTSRRPSTSRTSPWAGWARSCPAWSRGSSRPVDRGPQEPRPADRADRPIEAGARFADQHVRCDSGVGVAPGHRDR